MQAARVSSSRGSWTFARNGSTIPAGHSVMKWIPAIRDGYFGRTDHDGLHPTHTNNNTTTTHHNTTQQQLNTTTHHPSLSNYLCHCRPSRLPRATRRLACYASSCLCRHHHHHRRRSGFDHEPMQRNGGIDEMPGYDV